MQTHRTGRDPADSRKARAYPLTADHREHLHDSFRSVDAESDNERPSQLILTATDSDGSEAARKALLVPPLAAVQRRWAVPVVGRL
jgi:hypothetical protein